MCIKARVSHTSPLCLQCTQMSTAVVLQRMKRCADDRKVRRAHLRLENDSKETAMMPVHYAQPRFTVHCRRLHCHKKVDWKTMNPHLQEGVEDFVSLASLVMVRLRSLSNRNAGFSYRSWSFEAKSLGLMQRKEGRVKTRWSLICKWIC